MLVNPDNEANKRGKAEEHMTNKPTRKITEVEKKFIEMFTKMDIQS